MRAAPGRAIVAPREIARKCKRAAVTFALVMPFRVADHGENRVNPMQGQSTF
jgi:hypothetical protein